ncbi:Disease resistance protein RPM1 [Acorus gramineus]|uniref:Disease resistance protein RPM1 n=1 Tax=Acorus gramineus TaxID=55184 RepID=A0AAV9AYV9_ACOGR|nr:Disease resistance protein RPM1 [Acorus gramineus]
MWSNPSLEVETVLQFSYLDLPPYLKPCFLYCTLFPEDYKITRTKLSRMWIAEGFVKAEGELSMEDLADSYYEELITRSLLQLFGFDKTLREIPQDLFGKLKYLRVLDLSMIFIEKLPDSIGKLVQLRYLDLSFSKIVELPDSLCNLQYLQTLNLTALVVFSVKLPNCLRRLQGLRHLNVQKMHLLDEDHDVIVPAGIGELVHLQTLNRFTIHDNNNKRSNKDDEGGCSNIHELLPRLRSLRLELCHKLRSLPMGPLRHATNLTELHLEVNVEGGIGDLVHVRELSLKKCYNIESLWNLPALQILKVRHCYALKDMTNLGATSLALIYFEFDDLISDFPGNNLKALKSVRVAEETLLCIEGPIAVLRLCMPQHHGPYWPVIKRFPHVQAKEKHMSGDYFTYTEGTPEPIICQPPPLPPPQLHQV